VDPVERHPFSSDSSLDGGDLDCGGGLLLLIRRHIDPLRPGQLLEIRSTETSVDEELPAWCRLTGNELVSWTRSGRQRSFLVCKGSLRERPSAVAAGTASLPSGATIRPVSVPASLPPPAPAPEVAPLSVMGIGSWPRPPWMLRAIHEHLEARLPDAEFEATGDDAARLAIDAQERAGVDLVTDGEQRRDSYASFVGGILDNCQLVPLADLAAMVEEPEKFEQELRALDVPAREVRHPVVHGPLGRSRPLAVHELEFARSITTRPVKVALPGPYLLARTMWLECLTDRWYDSRETLAEDVVRVLREELHFLLAAGAAIVQFDEPVLTEVVFTGPKNRRSFMCGALSEKGDPARELAFAEDLLRRVVAGVPRERTALHVCRGNWTRDESALLAGDYRPLAGFLARAPVGTLFLEFSTPRAGEFEALADLPRETRIGVGLVNPKQERIETVEEILGRAERAIRVFGPSRLLLVPDCGFATFADNPVASAVVAAGKLRSLTQARDRLQDSLL
jgi:5-methyltetrahydropteroyltriglutamate--homocysteine methyltransferase